MSTGREPRRVGHDGGVSDLVLKLGGAIIILGLFGLLVSSGLPDGALIVVGFAVAVGAIWLGLRLRADEPEDDEG